MWFESRLLAHVHRHSRVPREMSRSCFSKRVHRIPEGKTERRTSRHIPLRQQKKAEPCDVLVIGTKTVCSLAVHAPRGTRQPGTPAGRLLLLNLDVAQRRGVRQCSRTPLNLRYMQPRETRPDITCHHWSPTSLMTSQTSPQ